MEHIKQGQTLQEEAAERESKLARAAGMREQVNTAENLSSEQREDFLAKIEEAEAQLKAEIQGAYGELKNVDPHAFAMAGYESDRKAIEKSRERQEKEGRSYQHIEDACKTAWENVRNLMMGAGLTAAIAAETMAFAKMPTAQEAWASGGYLASSTESAQWMQTAIESGYITMAALAGAYALTSLNRRLRHSAAWRETAKAVKQARQEKGL